MFAARAQLFSRALRGFHADGAGPLILWIAWQSQTFSVAPRAVKAVKRNLSRDGRPRGFSDQIWWRLVKGDNFLCATPHFSWHRHLPFTPQAQSLILPGPLPHAHHHHNPSRLPRSITSLLRERDASIEYSDSARVSMEQGAWASCHGPAGCWLRHTPTEDLRRDVDEGQGLSCGHLSCMKLNAQLYAHVYACVCIYTTTYIR